MTESSKSYVPAAGHDLFLPLYDPLQWLLGGDAARVELIEAAAIQPGMRVLDIGCGTGSLVVELARRHTEVKVVGIDPDPKALARAAGKLRRAGLDVQLDEGFSQSLPYADASFDRVLSSFMFHHLASDVKAGMLAEVARVLAPGGEIHLLDFAASDQAASGWFVRLLHSPEHMRDNRGSRIIALLGEAGLLSAASAWQRRTLFGRVARFEASLPAQ